MKVDMIRTCFLRKETRVGNSYSFPVLRKLAINPFVNVKNETSKSKLVRRKHLWFKTCDVGELFNNISAENVL